MAAMAFVKMVPGEWVQINALYFVYDNNYFFEKVIATALITFFSQFSHHCYLNVDLRFRPNFFS